MTSNTNINAAPSVAVTSQFMQSFQIESPIVASSVFAAGSSQVSQDESELYFVGSAGSLFRVYPSAVSETGWACDPVLDGNGNAVDGVSAVAFGGNAGGMFYLFYLDSSGIPGQLILRGSTLYQNWVYFQEGQVSPCSEIRALPGGFGVARMSGSSGIWLLNPAVKSPAVLAIQYSPYPVHDFCSAFLPVPTGGDSDSSVFQAVLSYNANGSDDIVQGAYIPGQPVVSPVPAPYSLGDAVAVGQFSSIMGALLGLALDGDSVVEFVFEDGAYSNQTVCAGANLLSISVCGSPETLELYAVGADHRIYHTRKSHSGWSSLLPVEDSQTYVQLQTVTTSSGHTQAFLLTQTGDLFRLMQDVESGDWVLNELQFEPPPSSATSRSLVPTTIYSTQITVTNPDGTPYALQSGILTANDAVTVEANGQSVYIDGATGYSVSTDLQGRVHICQPVSCLGSPVLSLTLPFLASGSALVMDPSSTVQQTLATVAAADLTSPDNCTLDNRGTTGPLLSSAVDPKDVEHAVRAINKAAAMILPWESLSPPTPQSFTFARRTDSRVVTYCEGLDPGNFALPRGRIREEGRWSIEKDSQGLHFLSGDAVVFNDQSPTSFLDFDFSWGDLVDLISEHLWDAVKLVIDGTKAVIHLVVNGVEKVIHAVIETASQVFDVIEIVFDWIGATFSKLCQFLAFIFNFDDITAVAKLLETAVNGVMGFIPLALQALKLQVSSYSAQVQQEVTNAFTAAIATLTAKNQTMASGYTELQTGANTGTDTALFADDHSIARAGLSRNITSSTSTVTNPNLTSSMSAFNTQLAGLYTDTLLPSPAYNQWIKSGDSWQAPSDATGSALSTILQNGEAITLAAISGLESIAEVVLDGAADCFTAVSSNYLNGAWDIPFISELYQEITGSTLNTLGLTSLLVALPLTMTLKLLSPAAIPSATTQGAFAAWCNPTNLMDASGLNGSDGIRRAKSLLAGIADDGPAWQDVVGRVFGWANGFTSLASSFLEPLLDLWFGNIPLSGSGQQRISNFADKVGGGLLDWANLANPCYYLSVAVLALGSVSTILACPFLTQTGVFPLQWNSMGCLTLLWGVSVLTLAVDMISMLIEKVSARVSGNVFPCIFAISGLIQLAGTVYMEVTFKDENTPSWNEYFEMYVATIPQIDKFLHMDAVIELTEGFSYLVLPFVDQAAHMATAYLSFLNAQLATTFQGDTGGLQAASA